MLIERFLLRKYLFDWDDKSAKIKVIITIISSVVSTLSILLVIGSINGFQHVIEKRVHNFYPELGINHYNMPISNYRDLIDQLQPLPCISYAEPAIYSELILASFNEDQSPKSLSGCMFRTINAPDIKKAVMALKSRGFYTGGFIVEESSYLPVFLGSELAKKLRVEPGENFNLYIPFFRTTIAGATHKTQKAYLAGVIDTGLFRYNALAGFMMLGDLQSLLEINDDVLSIDIYLEDGADINHAKSEIKELTGANIRDYTFISQGMTDFYRLIKKGLYFLMMIILAVALFNIISMIILMILEKLKEFSVLNSLGMPMRSIAFLVGLKGFLIGVFSSFCGLLLALIISYAQNSLRLVRIEESVYDISYLPIYISPAETAVIMAVIILLNTLIPLFPSLRVLRLNPADILRYE